MPLPSVHLRTFLIAVGGLGLILGIGVAFWRWLNPMIRLRVVNETESPLIDVHITYPGGTRWVERIVPEEEALWNIRVLGSGSTLVLSYRDPQGLLVTHRCDLDLPSELRRDVELQVQPGRIRMIDRCGSEPA